LCAGGHELFCAIGQMLGKHRPGGFVEYLVMPAWSLYVLPTEISFAHGAVLDEREKFSGTTRAIVSVTP
jgi:threonine dehydrogenase-like Zn-dependent dehydrogenase